MRYAKNRKLQPYQVKAIRQLRQEGFPRRFIAKVFDVSQTVIYLISSYATYRDIK